MYIFIYIYIYIYIYVPSNRRAFSNAYRQLLSRKSDLKKKNALGAFDCARFLVCYVCSKFFFVVGGEGARTRVFFVLQ